MMWFRQQLMDILVWAIGRCWDRPICLRLQGWHGSLLAAQMAARRKVGKQEVKTGVYEMTDAELDEYGRSF